MTADTTGARIRRRRDELGLTLYRLNEMTGFTHPAILSYEHGRSLPKAVQAVVLARALGVTVEWLMEPAVNEWLQANGFDTPEPLTTIYGAGA